VKQPVAISLLHNAEKRRDSDSPSEEHSWFGRILTQRELLKDTAVNEWCTSPGLTWQVQGEKSRNKLGKAMASGGQSGCLAPPECAL